MELRTYIGRRRLCTSNLPPSYFIVVVAISNICTSDMHINIDHSLNFWYFINNVCLLFYLFFFKLQAIPKANLWQKHTLVLNKCKHNIECQSCFLGKNHRKKIKSHCDVYSTSTRLLDVIGRCLLYVYATCIFRLLYCDL